MMMSFQSQKPVPDKILGFGRLHVHAFLVVFLFEIPLAMTQPRSNNQQEQSPYQKLSPQMVIMIVILIAALFLMGLFSVFICRCFHATSGNVRANGGAFLGRSRRLTRGLDAEVINSFPTLEYSEVKEHKIGKGALECAVCLCEFEVGETLRFIPKCDHVFHSDCVDAWLASHTTCPVCRANLVPQPGESIHGIPQLHTEPDVEDQRPAESATEVDGDEVAERPVMEEPEPASVGGWLRKTLNRNRTRRSRSDRFTLRLPVEVRKQILNRELHRASSVVVLPREGSTRRGYRSGSVGNSSSRGKFYQRLEKLDPSFKLDRWVFTMAPPFLTRASSSGMATRENEENMEPRIPHPPADSGRPPV